MAHYQIWITSSIVHLYYRQISFFKFGNVVTGLLNVATGL